METKAEDKPEAKPSAPANEKPAGEPTDPTVLELHVQYLSNSVRELSGVVEALVARVRRGEESERRTQLARAIHNLSEMNVRDDTFYSKQVNEKTIRADYIRALQRELEYLYQ